MTALTVEQVAARLDDRFRLLSGGRRTALRRQQTLEAAIDWSYNLLTEPERALLRRLAVFAGGWTLEAAEAVGAAPDDSVLGPQSSVLDLLTRLVEKSLVVAEAQGEAARYRLLETIRQYAGEKLLAAGEAAAVRDRHRDWYLAFVEQAQPGLEGRDQLVWLSRLKTEHDNLRAALEWSHADANGAEAEVRLAGALGGFWVWRGYLIEGRERLAGALARSAGVAPAVRALVLKEAGWMAALDGDMDEARALLAEGLALARAAGDRRLTVQVLRQLGAVAIVGGNATEVRILFDEALSLARQAGTQRETAMSLHLLARYLRGQGDDGTARQLLEEGLVVSRASGDRVSLALILEQLGQMAIETGDYSRARVVLEEVLTHHRAIDYKHGINQAHGNLGDLALAQGDLAAARAYYRDSLATAHDWGDRYQVRQALIRLAWLSVAWGQHRRAARLFGAGHEAQRVFLYLRERYERGVAAARAALGEVAFDAAWSEGQALPLDEAVAEALADEEVSPL